MYCIHNTHKHEHITIIMNDAMSKQARINSARIQQQCIQKNNVKAMHEF